jgi:hypothetical protein
MTDEGLRVYSTSLGIIEFLPRVPWPRYQFIVEMRQEEVLVPANFRCGIYCQGAHFQTHTNMRHLLPTVHWFDPFPDKHSLSKTAWFRLLLVGLPQDRKAQRPYFYSEYTPTNISFPCLDHKGGTTWRKVVFEVAPTEVRPIWFSSPDQDKGNPFPSIRHDKYRWFFSSIRDDPVLARPELKGVEADSLEFTTHGIVVSCGSCIIRRLAVVPNGPAPGKEQ